MNESTERRDIPGYDGMYQIDRQGNVYAMFAWRGLPPGWSKSIQTNSYGYQSVVIKGKTWFVHRLMLLTWQPIENSRAMDVNHIDGNKTNNHLENLEWLSHRDNIIHAHQVLDAWATNQVRGEHMNTAKLIPDQVREIRRLHATGINMRALGSQFRVTPENIRAIVLRQSWRHIE